MRKYMFSGEHYKMLAMLKERNAYRDMALKMQEALKAIAYGDGDARKIAAQTLNQLTKEYGSGPQ
jgi:hemerythrin-like domain-containing protein